MAETFNPYPLISTQLKDGLNAIATAFAGGGSTVDDLVTAIYDFIQPLYYPVSGGGAAPTYLQVEIKSVAYNIINSYNNTEFGKSLTYNPQQMSIARQMIGLSCDKTTPINALDHWFTVIEENISRAGLSIDQQSSLLLGIEFSKSAYAYWIREVDNAMSVWSAFFQSTGDRNYPNIPFWTDACTEGALLGANASKKGLIAPTTDIVSVNIVSALIGALAIGAGKVIFKWVPNIPTNNYKLSPFNVDMISLNPPAGDPSPTNYVYQTPSGSTSTATANGFGPPDSTSDTTYTTDMSSKGTWLGLGNQ